MNFATWSLRNPIPIIVLFALLTMAGLWSFVRLPIQDMPDIEDPTVNIELAQPGVTPAQLETEVARPVENAIASLDRLAHMRTTITDGKVEINVEFALDKPLSEALSEVKDAVDGIRATLPKDLEEPSISAVKVFGGSLATYAVTSAKLDEEALSWFLDDVISKRIWAIPGVGRFERIGGVDREITVEIDPESAMASGATPMSVSRALQSMQNQFSGGRGKFGAGDQSVRVSALVPDAHALERIAIPLPNGSYAKLGDIGQVEDGIRERSQIALLDGRAVVGFRIFPTKGADATKLASAVASEVAALVAETPGLQVDRVASSVGQILQQYDGSMNMLYEGSALAMLVVWLFLRDWRAMVVAAVSLVLSILPVFAGMELLGFSLNTLTLLAVAVTIGILVDDVIVEVENVKRHQMTGKPIRQATADAVQEIAMVVLATTLCLVCAFLPTAIMPGIPGLLFKQFGWTAIIAVLSSLLVARTLTPLLAVWMLRSGMGQAPTDSRLMRLYLASVEWCLSHRLATMAAAGLFFVASLVFVPLIPTGLIPADDVGTTTITIEMAPGTALDATKKKMEEVRRALAAVRGVEHVFAVAGTAGAQGGDSNNAELLVTLASREVRPSQPVIEDLLRGTLRDVPGARFSVGSDGLGQRVELMLASDDPDALRQSARAIVREMRSLAGVSNVKSTASLERSEIVIRPDTVAAAERGISTEQIGNTVRVATGGDFDNALGRLNFDSRQVFLRVRFSGSVRADPQSLANIRISGSKGLIPLSSIADISVESGQTEIERFDRTRYISINADLRGASFGDTMAEVMSLRSVESLPSGVFFVQSGGGEVAADLQTGFITAIATGIFCVYGVLVVLFKDFAQPVTILSAIPFSLGGALALLLVSGSQLNVPSLIGMVMLIGVVTKNSILLVEYAIMAMQDDTRSVRDALIDACQRRARPIIMTSVAMIAGMAPVAVGLGSDTAFRQPMALAVIGGLLTSTVLSLLIVPVVFSCVRSARRRFSMQAGLAGASGGKVAR